MKSTLAIAERNLALFLDIDGTLLEIAARPDAVDVPDELLQLLEASRALEAGALALISGRTLANVDRLFAPLLLPASGLHGYERRDASNCISRLAVDVSPLQGLRAELSRVTMANPGLLLEDKGAGLVLHYRAAPELEALVQELMQRLAAPLAPQFKLRPGKCVLELAPAHCSKRTSIEDFMQEPPFAGRTPVFIGDDVTDEDGFIAVNALGGHSVRVGGQGTSAARHRLKDVRAVRAWLRERYASPGERITT